MVDGRREKRGGAKEEKSEPKREAERYLAVATRWPDRRLFQLNYRPLFSYLLACRLLRCRRTRGYIIERDEAIKAGKA